MVIPVVVRAECVLTWTGDTGDDFDKDDLRTLSPR